MQSVNSRGVEVNNSTPSLTTALSRYVCHGSFSDIPAEVADCAKKLILDCLGVAATGAKEPVSQLVVNYVRAEEAAEVASVFGQGFKSSATGAALANGTMAHALDFDDYQQPPASVHGSAVLVPSILALGDEVHATGEQVIVSYLYGLGVMTALGSLMNPSHYTRGWHPTATIGTLGATAAAGRILELTEESMAHAFSIAASEAGGIRLNIGSMTKPLHAGLAARNGIQAAKLAALGLTGRPDALGGEQGWMALVSDSGMSDPHPASAPALVGWELVTKGLALKFHAACGAAHSAIDATLAIRRRHPEVEAEWITCILNPLTENVLAFPRPINGAEAKFSAEYAVSVSWLDGLAAERQFTDERVSRPDIRSMLDRVRVEFDDALSARDELLWPAIVRVHFSDGAVCEERVDVPAGKPACDRAPWDRTIEKFIECVRPVLGMPRAQRSVDLLRSLHSIRDIREVTELFTRSQGRGTGTLERS